MVWINLIIILIIILLVAAIVYIYFFNKMQSYKTRIDYSESMIDEALRNKYDKICEASNEIKKEFPDKDYLKEYTELKEQKLTNFDLDRKLIEAFNIIKEVMQDNDNLKNDNMNGIIKGIKKYDEQIVSGKNFYNKNSNALNDLIRKFPSNIVAKTHGFKIKTYFDGKNMTDAVLDDFKL